MMKVSTTGAVCLVLSLTVARSAIAEAPLHADDSGTVDVSTAEKSQNEKYDRRLSRTATSALSMAVVTAGLYAASDVLFFLDHDTPAASMGFSALGLTAGLTPVFYLSNRSAFRHFCHDGLRPLRVWGFVMASIAVADVLGVAIAGVAASITPMYGLISVAGFFSAAGFTLFALDGLIARKRIRSTSRVRQRRTPRFTLAPFVSEIESSPSGIHGATIGVVGTFL